MPAYSFSIMEFVPRILDGSKPHTIRPRRKHPTKPDDLLYLYYKQRTPECRLICITVCKNVMPIMIYPRSLLVKINGAMLSIGRTDRLAKADGFINLLSFFKFFERYERDVLDDFELVEWYPDKLIKLWDEYPLIKMIDLSTRKWKKIWDLRFEGRIGGLKPDYIIYDEFTDADGGE